MKKSEEDFWSPDSEDLETTAQRGTSSVLWYYWQCFHSTAKEKHGWLRASNKVTGGDHAFEFL